MSIGLGLDTSCCLIGLPSHGRSATLTGTTVDVVSDGKIVEHWAEVGVPLFLQRFVGAASYRAPC